MRWTNITFAAFDGRRSDGMNIGLGIDASGSAPAGSTVIV